MQLRPVFKPVLTLPVPVIVPIHAVTQTYILKFKLPFRSNHIKCIYVLKKPHTAQTPAHLRLSPKQKHVPLPEDALGASTVQGTGSARRAAQGRAAARPARRPESPQRPEVPAARRRAPPPHSRPRTRRPCRSDERGRRPRVRSHPPPRIAAGPGRAGRARSPLPGASGGPGGGNGATAPTALTPQGLAAAPAILRRGENPGPPPVPPADGSRRPAPRGLGGPRGAPAAGPRRRRPPGGLRYLPARAVGGSTPRAAPRPFPPSCPGLKLTRRDVRAPPRDLYRPAAARGARARRVLAPSAARRGRGSACATRSPAGGGRRRAHARFAFDGLRGVRGLCRRGVGRRVPPLRAPSCRSAPGSALAAVRTGCGKALGLRGCLLVEVTSYISMVNRHVSQATVLLKPL